MVVVEGNGGLTKVVLKHACGSQAEVRALPSARG